MTMQHSSETRWSYYLASLRKHELFTNDKRDQLVAHEAARLRAERKGARKWLAASFFVASASATALAYALTLQTAPQLIMPLGVAGLIMAGLYVSTSGVFFDAIESDSSIAQSAFDYANPSAARAEDLDLITKLVYRAPELAPIVQSWRDVMGELSQREVVKLWDAQYILNVLETHRGLSGKIDIAARELDQALQHHGERGRPEASPSA